MNALSLSPLTPLVILALGTGALLVGGLPRLRYPGPVAVAAAAAALLTVLAMAGRLPARATLSAWGPPSLLPVGLTLEADWRAWLYALAALVATLAALLTGAARPGGRRIVVRGAMLLLAFAGLAAFFVDNLIARIMAWAGLDLIYFLALILLARGGGMEPQAVLNLAFNSAGTLLALGAALLISRESPALSLRDAALTPQSTLFITLAAVFRLGLFPLHLALPAEANVRQGLGTLLRLIPAAVALETVGRLAVFGFAEPVRPWLTVFGAAAALVGATQLWNIGDPRLGITYVVIAHSGLALLAGLWGGAQASAGLIALALSLIAGAAPVFLSTGHDPERPLFSALPFLGALTLAGAPLTVGAIGLLGLYAGLMEADHWLALIVVLIAQVILVAGLTRTVLWPGQPLEGGTLARASYFAGLALSVAFALSGVPLIGLLTSALGEPAVDVLGWGQPRGPVALGLWLLATALGFVLWRFENAARSRADVAWAALASLFRLDWLYRLLWDLIRGLAALIRNLAEVLEGEGAILWTLVVVLLVWLAFR
jgi:formate hydrogenlyase subunit 3/multisubunit Na+/H+ antiporter MnhD subunit